MQPIADSSCPAGRQYAVQKCSYTLHYSCPMHYSYNVKVLQLYCEFLGLAVLNFWYSAYKD